MLPSAKPSSQSEPPQVPQCPSTRRWEHVSRIVGNIPGARIDIDWLLYSVRRACIGSIEAAWRAGRKPAVVAQKPSTKLAVTRAKGSYAATA
jgi:hypothetical protein